MPLKNADEPEFLRLLNGLCDKSLSGEDLHRLQDMLRDDQSAQNKYFAFIDLHLGLKHIADVEGSSAINRPAGGDNNMHLASSVGRRNYFVPILVTLTAVSAASLLAMFFLWRNDPLQEFVATADEAVKVTRVDGQASVRAVDGQVRSATIGMEVTAGEHLETAGVETLFSVSYNDGSEMLMIGDAALSLDSENVKRVTVDHGTISAYVAVQSARNPMSIRTPQVKVEVRGTQFMLSAAQQQTDLRVNEGSVELTSATDGRSVVVNEGKQVTASHRADLAVKDSVSVPDDWRVDFEEGLSANWQQGELLREGLPDGSSGAVKAVKQGSENFAIDGPMVWMDGLFVVHPDTHLKMRYKMKSPGWINIFFISRSDEGRASNTTLHLFNRTPVIAEANAWYEITIPLNKFHRKTKQGFQPVPPVDGEICFGMLWSAPDRGLVIDNVEVSRGGPGKVVRKRFEEE